MLLDKLKEYNIILASQSPRRRELLSMMGLEFTVGESYEFEEVCPSEISASMQPEYLSLQKSINYPTELKNKDLLITSDTLVIQGDKVFGKPRDKREAISYLRQLSGKSHKVISGVTLRTKNQSFSFSDTTEVSFATLTDGDIAYYVSKYQTDDKAGAYAIQEWIGLIGVSSIVGSYFNIMGLPTEALYRELRNFIKKL